MTKTKTLIIALLALFVMPLMSCRQANTQTVAIQSAQSDDPRLYTRDIPLPSPLTDRAEQILYRKSYVVSYNKDTRQPNWVAWHLTSDHTSGNVPRPTTAWHEDKDVPEPRAYHSDYRDGCWDRGHMCPAGDNKWDSDAMYETFLMSNACPQSKTLNSGTWNQIEISCRTWARKYGDIFIFCGPIFYEVSGHATIGKNNIRVPDAFFKVVVRLEPTNPKGIAFICPNSDESGKMASYATSINEVERVTGNTFLPDLQATCCNLTPESLSAIKSNTSLRQF